jgi:hypothetical protein
MTTEIYSNLFSTTLASGYTAGSGTVVVTSMTGAPSSSAGNWRLLLDRGGANVILKVTAASGTTLTVTAEANDANVASGKTADGVITAGALDAIKADVLAQTGVIATPSFVTADQSTTSTTYVDLATADTVTFTLAAATNVIVQYEATCYTSGASTVLFNAIFIDETQVVVNDFDTTTINASNSTSQTKGRWFAPSLAAGVHTVNVKHRVNNSTGHWVNRLLWIIATP